MPHRVRWALLIAACLHGGLILTAQYRLSYDAYTHMFFADHYLNGWWSLWEPRWYTGFEVTSYPPLVHQVIALLGSVAGVDAAYALVLWGVVAAYPLAIYHFSRIFTGPAAASLASLGAALLPSLFLTAHIFGQLPTLVSALLSLAGAVALYDFLRRGGWLSGLLVVSLFAASMAGHHATLLFQPWLAGAVLLRCLSQPGTRQGADRRTLFARFLAVMAGSALASLAVVWPFWEWQRSYVMQTPIDHISRHNFLTDRFAALIFFLPMYGLLIPLLPAAVWLGRLRRFWGLGLSFLFLFLLGLGGTTPLPRWLFGQNWAWLTYDRFSFWASLLLLPLLAAALVPGLRRPRLRPVWPLGAGLLAVFALIVGLANVWLPTQPPPLPMQPLVDFLNQDGRGQYRYLTFGFGDQLARLSRLMDATTIDGSYHTARTLPELRRSGIGQVDTAFWLPGGLDALDPILQASGERGVRWGFVNLKFYEPVVRRNGWVKVATLENGVTVWENPDAVLPPPVEPPDEPPFKAFSWGVFPLLSLAFAATLSLRRYRPAAAEALLDSVMAFAAGLLPLGLTFWYYRELFPVEQERIYFIYSDALFFLSDGFALALVLAWLLKRIPAAGVLPLQGTRLSPVSPPPSPRRARWRERFSRPEGWLLAGCLLASLSVLWSLEWRTSLYISLHLWLCLGLFLALREVPQARRWFALGCVAALLLQFAIGLGQFAEQSTALTAPLGLTWPGPTTPDLRGASVVQLADGARWLRAYGSLPHPNLLGGFALALLAAPLGMYLGSRRRSLAPLPLFLAALAVLVLSFSRSAWLGAAVLGGWTLLHARRLNRANLLLLSLAGLAALLLLAAWLSPLFLTRLGQGGVQTEQVSNYTRYWLVLRAVELIRERPLLGYGIGSFSLALHYHVADFYQIEPVHNVPLLVWSELGAGGVLLLGGFLFTMARAGLRIGGIGDLGERLPAAVVLFAALLGLFTANLFDHYLWTLAPGRILAATLLGLWAGANEPQRALRAQREDLSGHPKGLRRCEASRPLGCPQPLGCPRIDVVVNGRFLSRRVTGVERYGQEVLKRLEGDLDGCPEDRLRVVRPGGGSQRLAGHLWEQLVLPGRLRPGEILFSLANTGPLAVRRQVLVIHDLSVLEHPEWFSPAFGLWYRLFLPALARRLPRLVVPSEYVRRKLEQRFSLPAGRVVVAPAGVDQGRFHPGARRPPGLPDEYVLFVGSLQPRKNLPLLLEAWQDAGPRFPQAWLLVAGAGGRSFAPLHLPDGLDRVRFLGYVPDDDLPGLYAGAAVLALPSLDEGFGLPALEAMACGAAVIAARAGALPEVTGEAGLLFDPARPDELAGALARLLAGPDLRHCLREKGFRRAQDFSWQRTAGTIWEVLQSCR